MNKFSEIKRNIAKRCNEAIQKDLEKKKKMETITIIFSKTRPNLTLPLKNNKNNIKTNNDIYPQHHKDKTMKELKGNVKTKQKFKHKSTKQSK